MKPDKPENDDVPKKRRLTPAEDAALTRKYIKNILDGFDEVVRATEEWLELPSTEAYFFKQSERLTSFMENSGIRNEWQNMIHERATKGADMVEEIYKYGRQIGHETEIIEYTQTEQRIINNLCDYNYELIKSVNEEHINNIRTRLIDDFGNGVNPRNTNLKEMRELPSIRGWTPEYRAELIARTETARATNLATLQDYKAWGAQYVELIVNTDCDICTEAAKDEEGESKLIPIDEAIDDPIFHPNCKCTWKVARNPETGLRYA